MTLRTLVIFWLAAAFIFVLLVYVFSAILLPFVAGMALAYFLDPVASALARLGLSRTIASSAILLVFVVLLALTLILLLPVLGSQLAGLVDKLPAYFDMLQHFVNTRAGTRLFRALHLSTDDIRGSLGSLVSNAASFATTFLSSIWNGGQALMSLLSLVAVTPVVAFYLLIDWNDMIRTIDSWVPVDYRDTVRRLAREMDRNVSNFVRGQVSVSVLLALFYAVSLSIAGLNFGLLIGLFAGLTSVIPFVGSIGGGMLAIGVALVQFWPNWVDVLIVAGIFGAGQFLEGNVLQPRLIGSSVGLHPVWLMFALLAFGTLFGFLGLLIAVPASAAVAVLLRFALAKYRESAIYRGSTVRLALPDPAQPPRDDSR